MTRRTILRLVIGLFVLHLALNLISATLWGWSTGATISWALLIVFFPVQCCLGSRLGRLENEDWLSGTHHGMNSAQCRAAFSLLVQTIRNSADAPEIHHGDCVGADLEFHEMAWRLELPIVIHPPLDDKLRAYCIGTRMPEKDYLNRNRDIVDDTDLLIAIPFQMAEQRRSGTWYTIRYSRSEDRKRAIILPDGTICD